MTVMVSGIAAFSVGAGKRELQGIGKNLCRPVLPVKARGAGVQMMGCRRFSGKVRVLPVQSQMPSGNPVGRILPIMAPMKQFWVFVVRRILKAQDHVHRFSLPVRDQQRLDDAAVGQKTRALQAPSRSQ